jgi:transposase
VVVELSVMEQRYQAVMAVVQDGWKVTEVADRLGVARQSVHNWIARYDAGGLAALADRSHRPASCAHQIAPELEALICALRRHHPGWGPRRIEHDLAKRGVDPVPSCSSIYRCLKRHNLIELRRRRKRRDEFRRWERDRPMELWQMDVMTGRVARRRHRPQGRDRHRRPQPLLRRRGPRGKGDVTGGMRGVLRSAKARWRPR